MADPYAVPAALRMRYQAITEITDRVCLETLNDEYADLSRKMAAALARKRPSPIERGQIDVWACAIVYALGRINFLFDRSEELHLTADELCDCFGVKKSTAGNKAGLILDTLKIGVLDPRWLLSDLVEESPLTWMVKLSNGIIIDVRYASRELQEQAFGLGLIPYIPADRVQPAPPPPQEAEPPLPPPSKEFGTCKPKSKKIIGEDETASLDF